MIFLLFGNVSERGQTGFWREGMVWRSVFSVELVGGKKVSRKLWDLECEVANVCSVSVRQASLKWVGFCATYFAEMGGTSFAYYSSPGWARAIAYIYDVFVSLQCILLRMCSLHCKSSYS